MNPLQNTEIRQVIAPVAIKDNASWTTDQIDTQGFKYATIVVNVGATDIAMTALKVQESDTDGSNFADVTGLVYGTSTDIDGNTSALPTATDDNKIFLFEIDLRGRKRYLDLVATAGNGTNGTYASAVVILSREGVSGTAASDRCDGNVLRV